MSTTVFTKIIRRHCLQIYYVFKKNKIQLIYWIYYYYYLSNLSIGKRFSKFEENSIY